jgi:hypothetical protein
MKWVDCVYRLESPGWCICRKSKQRVRPTDCRECHVTDKLDGQPVKADKKVVGEPPNEIPSETPQEPHVRLPEITSLGTLIFTRTHWEPPPCPPGYHRADTPSMYVLEPDNPMCRHLELGTGEVGACGYPRLTRRCKLVDSFVGPMTCETCTKRGNDAG